MEGNNQEFKLITRLIKGQNDIDYIYKKSKIFDIIFNLATLILLSVVIIGLLIGWSLKFEIFFLIVGIVLQFTKIILDYRQYIIMVKLITTERKILDKKEER